MNYSSPKIKFFLFRSDVFSRGELHKRTHPDKAKLSFNNNKNNIYSTTMQFNSDMVNITISPEHVNIHDKVGIIKG
jgi:hypothetical protein